MGNQLVSIQSVPRSGSSWLGQIFRSSDQVAFRFQPLFSYAFKGRLDPHSSREEILEFFEDIHRTDDDFVLQRDAAIHVDYPAVQEPATASHVVMKEVRYNNIVRNLLEQVPEIKVIGLVRHPCAVIDSWIHAPREFDPQWSIAEEWRLGAKKNQGRPEEFFGFDKWKKWPNSSSIWKIRTRNKCRWYATPTSMQIQRPECGICSNSADWNSVPPPRSSSIRAGARKVPM
ncbi:MAG: sulfotransferase [Flavobacteriales bacterium]|nr:sulfotransferase [Flavobacteriales bacterium]